jgi:MSHA biogenesis protein MshP
MKSMSIMRRNSLPSSLQPACRMQRGFALASAIFLLVVLASLGAFMMNFSSVQHASSGQDLSGTKAYQAARAGIEWGTYQLLKNASCNSATTLSGLSGSLAGFSVQVQCAEKKETEGMVADNVTLYTITSTASIGGTNTNPHYVERQLQALVEK